MAKLKNDFSICDYFTWKSEQYTVMADWLAHVADCKENKKPWTGFDAYKKAKK